MNPIKSHNKNKTLEDFKALYADKSFFEDYYQLHKAAKYTGFVMQSLSALSGWAAPYSIAVAAFGVSSAFGHAFAALVAALVVIGVEVVFFILTKSFFKAKYKGAFSLHTTFGMVLIVGVSLFFSWYGGRELTKQLDTRQQDHAEQFAQDTALRLSDLRAQIARAEADKANDLKRFQWAGRVDVSNPAVKAVIASHAAHLQSLRDQYQNAVTTSQTAFLSRLDELKQSSEQAVNLSAIVAGCAVLVCLFCQWYVYYFAFVSYLEASEQAPADQTAQKQTAQVFVPQIAPQQEPEENGWEQGSNDRIAAGFKLSPIEPKAPVKVAGGWKITCHFCGATAVKSQRTAKFCSDKCRLDHHNAQKAITNLFR